MEEYYYVDLHVHTPASKDYKGNKNNDDEYYKILRQAKSNEISCICITDHNSVNGFVRIQELKNETSEMIKLWTKRGFDKDSKYTQVETEYNLLNSIHILLGIEVKLSPGIHYICVFKENIKVEDVSEFFNEITEGEFEKNIGSPDFMINITSIEFFSKVKSKFLSSCLIYAPHVDSSSGLIECLKNLGTERNSILKNQSLCCLGITRESSKDDIKSRFLQGIMKERNKAIHFIQDSDFHGSNGEEVGSLYFLLEKANGNINFENISKRLSDSKEIKTSIDTAIERYEEAKKEDFIVSIGLVQKNEDFSEEKIQEICKKVCAILNSEKGMLEFEIVIEQEKEAKPEITNLIEKIMKSIEKYIEYIPGEGNYRQFQVSKTKHKVLFKFEKSQRVALYDGRCYMFDADNTIKIANAGQVSSIVARKMYNDFGEDKDNLLNNINKISSKMRNNLLSFSISYKLDSSRESFTKISIKLLPSVKNTLRIKDLIDDQYNGVTEGDIVYIDNTKDDICGGRLKNSYLRITSPMYKIEKIDEDIKPNTIMQKGILVFPGGASYLIGDNKKLYNSQPCFYITLTEDADISLEVLIAYFKSSIFQWFLSKIYDFEDLFDYFINISVKHIMFFKEIYAIKGGVYSTINNILIEEKNFLKNIERNFKNKEFEKNIDKVFFEHNQKCDRYSREIDKKIFSSLFIDKAMIMQIYTDLKGLGIYEFSALENIKDFE